VWIELSCIECQFYETWLDFLRWCDTINETRVILNILYSGKSVAIKFSMLRCFGAISSNGCRPPVTAGVSWWSAMIEGCRAQQTSMERLNRLREANSQWKRIPISNGPWKKWIFKSISTNWQWHKFIFNGGSSMPWWNWEMIQRNGWKVIKRLVVVVENRQTRVFATFKQGQVIFWWP